MQCYKALVTGLACCMGAWCLSAQDCHLALHGLITEAETGEPIAFAQVWVKDISKGVLSDEHGHYTLANLCAGRTYTVEVGHISCAHQIRVIELKENIALDFALAHNQALEEIVVTERAMNARSTQAESQLSALDLDIGRGQNLGKALKNLPGVTTLNTGSSISKPVIQGLHSNRIAIVSNNVVLEGQQWGSEHAPEIDPYTANEIKVVKGAAGVRYGVGAMGGAVIIEPIPLRAQHGLGGWLSLGGYSNGRAGIASGLVDWHLPHRSLTFRAQLTAKQSGNVHAPDYFLGNSGNQELDGVLMAGWKKGAWEQEISYTHFSQQIAILGASHISDTARLNAAIRSDAPLFNADYFSRKIARPSQDVQHHTVKYRNTYRINEKWKASAQYAWQYNKRREFDAHPPKSDPQDLEKKPQQSFRIWTNMLDLSLEHSPIRHWQGGVGVQASQQLNRVGKGGFIPDYLGFGASLWAMERWRRFPNPWEFEAGVRADYRWNHVTTEGRGDKNIDKNIQFSNTSAAIGSIYHVNESWSATLHTGLAWRPPHVNELFAAGVHHGASTYEKGNAELKPEKGWNSNLTIQYQQGEAAFVLTAYRNQIRDFIYLNPQNKIVVTVRGPYPAYQYDQTQQAVLQGLDGSLTLPLCAGWSAETRFSMLRGRREVQAPGEDQAQSDWLPLMPSDRVQYGLSWKARSKGAGEKGLFSAGSKPYFRLLASTVFKQIRVPAEGLLKAAPTTYTTWDLDAGRIFHLNKKYQLEAGLSVQNLSNQRYREYLNFFRYYVDEPGINVGLRVKLVF